MQVSGNRPTNQTNPQPKHGGSFAPKMLGGLYDGKDNLITIYADPEGCPEDEHTILHEMVHALDRVKFQEERGLVTRLLTPERERDHSRHDPVLKDLHTS